MTFTDADLERLKAGCLFSAEEYDNQDAEDILGLIRRLEAAEEALTIYESSEGDVINGENILLKWRKMAGK